MAYTDRLVVGPPRYRVHVTDGWYAVPAQLDAGLEALVDRGRVCVGTKLLMWGSEVRGPT
jgi:hypothetical protein